MTRIGRAAMLLSALVGATTIGGITAAAGAAAIDVAPSAGAMLVVDRALDATARATSRFDPADATAVVETARFSCVVMGMTADPEADDQVTTTAFPDRVLGAGAGRVSTGPVRDLR
jgi:hypothetical protein